MPSILLGHPYASGAQPLVSGWPYAGFPYNTPWSFLELHLPTTASGFAYVGVLSGNLNPTGAFTINSGGFALSGSLGLADGMALCPGDFYNVPKFMLASGQMNVGVMSDAACSGVTRLYWALR